LITAEKPQLNEDLLIHFGIKGMKWGVRKSKSSSDSSGKKMSTKKKVAIGAGVAVGAAAVAFALTRRGKVPVKNVLGHQPGLSSPGTAARGRRAANDISQSEWRKRVSTLSKDIADANADQDRWMRRQGLGSASLRSAWNDPKHVWNL
jgi:hypothetical protein